MCVSYSEPQLCVAVVHYPDVGLAAFRYIDKIVYLAGIGGSDMGRAVEGSQGSAGRGPPATAPHCHI